MATVDSVARLLALGAKGSGGGGTGGTSNYPDLSNKPQINGVELVGNKTSEDLGIEQGVTEEVLTQALAAESAARQKEDNLLQEEIEDKIAAANILAGENIEVSQEGNNVTISSTAEGKTYTAGTNIEITEDNVINNTIPYNSEAQSSVILGDINIGEGLEANDSIYIGSKGAQSINDFYKNIVIGNDFNGISGNAIAIGHRCRSSSNSIAIGHNANASSSNQCVFGGFGSYIDDVYAYTSSGRKRLAFDDEIPEEVPIATTEVAGKVKPDGETITISEEGVISAGQVAETMILDLGKEDFGNFQTNQAGIEFSDNDNANAAAAYMTYYVNPSLQPNPVDLQITNGVFLGQNIKSDGSVCEFYFLYFDKNTVDQSTGSILEAITQVSPEWDAVYKKSGVKFNPLYYIKVSVVNGTDLGFEPTPVTDPFLSVVAEDIADGKFYEPTEGGQPVSLHNVTNLLSPVQNDLSELQLTVQTLEGKIETITTSSFEVVDELPTSNIKTNVIYLVPTQSSGIDNVYDEYIYVNNNWEKIGTTALDLSQYATKEYAEMVAANTINDTEVSNLTTYSSSKIESLSGIKVLTGTAEKPIIVSELETGNYVLSGTVQSSESNITTQTLSKKVYTVEKGDSETVVWYENPKTHITYTYIFDTVGTNAPEEQDEIYITETQLKQAVIDGGDWI